MTTYNGKSFAQIVAEEAAATKPLPNYTRPALSDGEHNFVVGESVDIEWIAGNFWRDGVITALNGEKATVRLPSGWHVYPYIRELRPKKD